MIKSLFALWVLFVLPISLCTCSGNDSENEKTEKDTVQQSETAAETVESETAAETVENATYGNKIKALLEDNNCVTCHGAGSATDISSYENVKVYVDSGTLKTKLEEGHMGVPKDIADIIIKWIDSGAPE